jgi:hypothetical protein
MAKRNKKTGTKRRKSQAQQELERQYRRERRRIQDFIRSNKKRGYRFEGELVPAIPKKITAGSVRKLQSITPEFLRTKATAYSEELDAIISGTEKKKEEQKERARKAARTRKEKKKQLEGFDREKKKFEDIYVDDFSSVDELVDLEEKLDELILQIRIIHPNSADYLKETLEKEYQQYGKRNVLKSIIQVDSSELEKIVAAMYYKPETQSGQRQIMKFHQIITGTIPTTEEAKEIMNRYEQDETYEEL